MPQSPIRLFLADVDGTLVTPAKELTPRAVAAVGDLHRAGCRFALTSGRPPRGMAMLVEPLAIDTPVAAFNGGAIVDPAMTVLVQRDVPAAVVGPVIEHLGRSGLDVWVYRGTDWLVRDRGAAHVDREAATVQFEPTVVDDFDGVGDGVAKIVGVSDDHDRVDRATTEARDAFGQHVSAAQSQPYYLDVTNPEANKGSVVHYLSEHYGIPAEAIATIGDMPNDVLMFSRSGLSIAMGNADREVQRAARHVTTSNAEEGFAVAVERYVLPRCT